MGTGGVGTGQGRGLESAPNPPPASLKDPLRAAPPLGAMGPPPARGRAGQGGHGALRAPPTGPQLPGRGEAKHGRRNRPQVAAALVAPPEESGAAGRAGSLPCRAPEAVGSPRGPWG